MPKKKTFNGYTPEEIAMIESDSYVIVVGSDFFDEDGHAAFDKASASRHYKKLVKALVEQMRRGNHKQKLHAENTLRGIRIEALRIH